MSELWFLNVVTPNFPGYGPRLLSGGMASLYFYASHNLVYVRS